MAIVTIVGRPNVGKSSIFNRILGRRAAIVDDTPGVTRDRLYGETEWSGKKFYIVDTGGIFSETEHPFMDLIAKQVDLALAESAAVIFVLDGKTGVSPADTEIAQKLRRSGLPVVVAMNKLDSDKQEDAMIGEAWGLGFDDVVGVSAEHNTGIAEMLDIVASKIESGETAGSIDEIRVALVGRPNVGKSSLFNVLAGEERSMVSDIAGTTRDVVDTVVETCGRKFRFLDTAGLRRKSRVTDSLEYYSNVRTFQAIDRCHVAVVLLDARDVMTDQDKRLINRVLECGKGCIIAVNKWDLIPRGIDKIGDIMTKKLTDSLPYAAHAPRVFISALTKRGVSGLPALILKVEENRRRRIPTSELNRLVKEDLIFDRMPTDGKGHMLRIYYCTQADGAPPAFIFFVNDGTLCTASYKRRLENILRQMADFTGVPIKIFMRNKTRE